MPTYEYPRPASAADIVVFGWDGTLKVLLMKRSEEPFSGRYAFPGRYVREGVESPEAAARTGLVLKTGLGVGEVFLVGVFGKPSRDPRGHVISSAFGALVVSADKLPLAGQGASDAVWVPADEVPALAFDHDQILKMARGLLAEKVRTSPIALAVMLEKFKVADLHGLISAVCAVDIDIRNFSKDFRRLLAGGVFVPAGRESGVAHRPGLQYSFSPSGCAKFIKKGGRFSL